MPKTPDNPAIDEPLLKIFREAYEELGAPVTELAEYLGITPEQAHLYVTGGVDLNMSEVRYLANFLGLYISYEVTPNVTQQEES
jgi:hypothetical protein